MDKPTDRTKTPTPRDVRESAVPRGWPAARGHYSLRPHRPGDMGWVVQQHGVLYSEEYGWDERFEGLVAGVVSQFIKSFDPSRERCWIAERGGERVGSIFVTAKSPTIAALRLLLIDPSARGAGLGRWMVDEVIGFARGAGYATLQLWTHPELVTARRIYKTAGFTLIAEEEHSLFGKPMHAETWELKL